MLFSWLNRRRRQRILAEPFPEGWLVYLHQHVPVYERLAQAEQARLRDELRVFVALKHWEGCRGLVLTDEIKVTIAAHACTLLLGIEHDAFDGVQSILVYPSGFRAPEGMTDSDGVVHTDIGLSGEAFRHGPVILAWDDVLEADQKTGRNVVLHEFAHQLDYLDGYANGTPPLHDREQYRKWHEVMTGEYERLVRESEHGAPKVLDAYGATNPAEFFAVATEAFFEKPVHLKRRHPGLYEVLAGYYGQDPALRLHPAAWAKATSEDRQVHEPVPALAVSPRRPYRGSRIGDDSNLVEEESANWPGWVRVWRFHPGWTRAQALARLDRFLLGALVLFILEAGLLLTAAPVLLLQLAASIMLVLVLLAAGWLYAAIRWVDGKGRWSGQYKGSSAEA